jgi:hypothetical protein
MLDAEHKADVEYTEKRGQALADLANSWEDATTEMQQELDLLGLSNVDRQKAILLEKARLDIIAAGGDAAAIRDINENLQAQLGLLDQINEKQQTLDIWNHLGDMAGEFANALTHGVGSAFDYLKQQAKQLLAEMIAIFAKRWILQLAAGQRVPPRSRLLLVKSGGLARRFAWQLAWQLHRKQQSGHEPLRKRWRCRGDPRERRHRGPCDERADWQRRP